LEDKKSFPFTFRACEKGQVKSAMQKNKGYQKRRLPQKISGSGQENSYEEES